MLVERAREAEHAALATEQIAQSPIAKMRRRASFAASAATRLIDAVGFETGDIFQKSGALTQAAQRSIRRGSSGRPSGSPGRRRLGTLAPTSELTPSLTSNFSVSFEKTR